MSALKNTLKITAIAAVSVPFALWFWLELVDIASVPFRGHLWHVEEVHETKNARSQSLEHVELVSSLTYAPSIRCHMSSAITGIGDDIVVSYSYQLEAPSFFTNYLYRKALNGCIDAASIKLHEMADAEDEERAKQHGENDDGKI